MKRRPEDSGRTEQGERTILTPSEIGALSPRVPRRPEVPYQAPKSVWERVTRVIPWKLIQHLGGRPGDNQSRVRTTSGAPLPSEALAGREGTSGALKTKIAISTSCSLLAVGHLIWPNVQIDMATIILLLVAVLPWLAGVVRSVQLPGGFKIELQDVKTATEKVTSGKIARSALPLAPIGREENLEFLRQVAQTDPNLALVGLRIEIERRLARLAADLGLPATRRSAGALLRDLITQERIDRETASGLNDLIALGNQAAHGAEVTANAAAWALDDGPLVLELLDSLIAGHKSPE